MFHQVYQGWRHLSSGKVLIRNTIKGPGAGEQHTRNVVGGGRTDERYVYSPVDQDKIGQLSDVQIVLPADALLFQV